MLGILRSEWTKFFSYTWCVFGIIGADLVTPLVVFFMGRADGLSLPISEVLALCLRAMYLGQVGIIVAAAGFFGQEYVQSCLRTTFLTVPSRMKLMASKLIVLTIIVVLTGVITGILCLAVGVVRYHCDLTAPLTAAYMANVVRATLSWVQIACITSGLSMLMKSMIAPIAIVFPLILGLSEMLFSLSSLARYLPGLAAMNLFLTPNTPAFLGIWQGVAAQFIWVILFATSAVWLTLRRDVR